MSARFWPYWPNSMEASRLSSKSRTMGPGVICEDSPLSGRGERNDSGLPSLGLSREHAEKAVRARLHDDHGHDLADEFVSCCDLHRLQIWGTANDLARTPTRLLEENVKAPPDAARIKDGLLRGNGALPPVQPLKLHILRNLALHVCRWSSRAWRIFEREGSREANLVDERNRGGKIIFAF